MEQELIYDGAGDSVAHHISDSDTPSYVKRKLKNGLPVPVYTTVESDLHLQNRGAHGDGNYSDDGITDFGRNKASSCVPPRQVPVSTLLKEYLGCPICKEICIETTTTNCGHKFCKQCIDDARQKTPLCPICSSVIISLHRLYADDLLIESQLGSLSPDVKNRFQNAQKKRLETLIMERKSRTIIKKVRRKLDNSLTYLRCKSSNSLGHKLYAASRSAIAKVYGWTESSYFTLLLGLFGGAVILSFIQSLKDSTFIRYMWLAMKYYNGEIPKQWIAPQQVLLMLPSNANTTDEVPVDDRSMFDVVVSTFDPFYKWIP